MRFLRIISILLAFGVPLGACSSMRGGILAKVEDKLWFPAHTKQHRALRGYMMLGSLARLAGHSPLDQETRDTVGTLVGRAVNAAAEVKKCADKDPCAFFDDRMVELDLILLRLASTIFDTKKNQQSASVLVSYWFGEDSALLDLLRLPAEAVKTAGTAVNATGKTLDVVQSLLSLSFDGFQQGLRIGALYRDGLELDMQVAMASCGNSAECQARDVWGDGNGDTAGWAAFLRGLTINEQMALKPKDIHFKQVSDLIWRACDNLGLKADDQKTSCRSYDPATGKGSLILGLQIAQR